MTHRVSMTAEQHGDLLAAERILHDLLPQIDHLEHCGQNCAALRSQISTTQQQIQALRQYFSPTGENGFVSGS